MGFEGIEPFHVVKHIQSRNIHFNAGAKGVLSKIFALLLANFLTTASPEKEACAALSLHI